MLDFSIVTGISGALTQLIKGFIPSKWVPLTGVVLGVGAGVLFGLSKGAPLLMSLVEGLIAGLVANGLYDNIAAHVG